MSFQVPLFNPKNVAESIAVRRGLTSAFSSAAAAPAAPSLPSVALPAVLPAVLPPVHEVHARAKEYVGPTPESNWVILGRLMVGAYPASAYDDSENEQILESILRCRVSTFVCLQQEYHHGAQESMWRSGQCLRPYIEDAVEICHKQRYPEIVPAEELKFLHHGIVDCGTTNDLTVLELAADVCNRLLLGEVIYLHCWGGHGRTGTVVAVALGLLYGLSASEALMRTQLYHDLRVCNLNVGSPQTLQQREQVIRILTSLKTTQQWFPKVPMIANLASPSSPQAMPSPKFEKEIRTRAPSIAGWAGV